MNEYQYNFSDNHQSLFDSNIKIIKSKKTIAVLEDYLGDLKNLNLLDIGCSSGIMTFEYAKYFNMVTGIDLDSKAVEFAIINNQPNNIKYMIGPIEESGLLPNTFDVITCSNIYEHVPSAQVLMDKIFTLLKEGGTCYFTAQNRYNLDIIEPHYKLPFLSWLPKKIAHYYIRIFTNENSYYETHLSMRKLKKLTSKFEVTDYTLEIIKNPEKYFATDMLKEKSFKHYLVRLISIVFYYFFPTYVFLLKKPLG